MKKILILVLVIAIFLVPSAFAQFRLDMGLDIPVQMGIHISELTNSTDTSVNILEKYTFLLPEATGSYQVSLGPVKLGAGVQLYTLILESIAWPVVYGELDLSPVVLSAKVGGLGFLVFGLYNHSGTGDVLIPDINVAYKLGKSFRLGVGVMGFTGKDMHTDNVPYLIYLSGRFSMLF